MAALHPGLAGAVLDIKDAGPTARAGNFAMRVTNAGILGNAFFDVGLSDDPSFEFPIHSGNELMHHAELWVGALDEFGAGRVSGGPALEWRPTLDSTDVVREAWRGRLGARQLVDDDGDGRIDEEILNGRDDDGDGEVDEDLGFSAQQMLAAEYVDDRPEAIYSNYPGGQQHQPLGLSVHQEVYAWGVSGYDGIAGLEFTITNHGPVALEQVYVGLFADFDSRRRSDPVGHLNDQAVMPRFARSIYEGTFRIIAGGAPQYSSQTNPQGWTDCFTRLGGSWPGVRDGVPGLGLPAVALVPLDHTTDPLAYVDTRLAYAPATVSFRSIVLPRSESPAQGGLPILDVERYAALAGRTEQASLAHEDDYAVLVSCGPFPQLPPGKSIRFAVAIVAAADPDSLGAVMDRAALLHHGRLVNMLPDSLGPNRYEWTVGETGLNGHEICLEAPAGVVFYLDPHCGKKFADPFNNPDGYYFPPQPYRAGECRWTDLDCDPCTGLNGNETRVRWLDPGALPPSPPLRTVAGDRRVRIEWNNLPEIQVASGMAGNVGARFVGYRVYKLADWSERESLLPPRANWELLAAFGADSSNGERPLAGVTDSTLDYERILFGQRLYPPGRYALEDTRVLDGFDYLYAVTSVTVDSMRVGSRSYAERHESPLDASFGGRVTPHAAARSRAGDVWVVPNPYRAHAGWERPPVLGDDRIHHVDFFGLPRALCTIKIWTLAGDLVARIGHDGSNGDGQAAWDLISRNGQDVESGVYLFTVDSPLGSQVGRFVIIR